MKQIYDDNFLLTRLFTKLETNKKQKLVITKTQTKKQNRKTFVTNFSAICQSLKRTDITVKNFIENAIERSTSIMENGSLVIPGKFEQAEIEKIFTDYVRSNVLCQEEKCLSGNTEIIKDSRVTYLVCKTCKSKKVI